MAKGLTKTALIRTMAEQMELPTKQVAQFFDVMAQTAVKETKKNGEFTIPGLGKLVKAERKARRRPQSADGRSDQDQGKDCCEVPRGKGCEGFHRTCQGYQGSSFDPGQSCRSQVTS